LGLVLNDYEKLIMVHLNDRDFFPDDHGNLVPKDHQALGEGEVPYQDIIHFLVADIFKRVIVFELPLNKGVQSINLLVEQGSETLVQ
jgi:sugar phosphate isomerase/epimerase